MHQFKRTILAISLLGLTSVGFTANPVNIKIQSTSVLRSFYNVNQVNFKEISRTTDVKKVTHVRMKQTYQGYPVWGGDVIVHLQPGANANLNSILANPNATVNGVVYENINKDLQNTPSFVFTAAQAEKALTNAIQLYQKKAKVHMQLTNKKTELMVFVDKNNKAHWAFLVKLVDMPDDANIAAPSYILDAVSFAVYKEWNNLMTAEEMGGGFGGNIKMGERFYDALDKHFPKLNIERNPVFKICFLKNSNVTTYKGTGSELLSYGCKATDPNHNGVYWNGEFGAINGGYSPGNDALYSGKIIQDMYQTWYGVPVLKNADGTPMKLNMHVHLRKYDNAFFLPDNNHMYFGDGYTYFYPLVSLDVGAHEISHGFTHQNSDLDYSLPQGAALHEAFSDMAAKAAQFFSTKENTWELGPEVFKAPDQALRYLDNPTKDCRDGQAPGDYCSIDNMKDYNDDLDGHFGCGVFNKAFYLIATTPGWNTKMAFDIMVKANQSYWRPQSDFHNAANCVVKSAMDLGYPSYEVVNAFNGVGIYGTNADNCY